VQGVYPGIKTTELDELSAQTGKNLYILHCSNRVTCLQ